jgi:ribosome-binding protein aMBF1 (putative translation factor)
MYVRRMIKEKIQERINDSHLKKELETIQPEVEAVRTMIKARLEQGLTQKDLAQRVGMDQADISKLENGTRAPSLKLLKKLAEGLDMELRIHFEPKAK